jgi:ribosomal protein S8
MITIALNIDTVAAKRFIDQLSGGDIAYATANAMNETMNEAQTGIRQKAYAQAFMQRNKALPKALTTIRNADRANKRKLVVTMQNVRDGKTGRMAGEGFIERQVAGASKVGRGNIAIPVIGPGLRRGASGSFPKALKPKGNAKLFRVGGALVERQKGRKKLVTRYLLQKTARPSRKGRFEYTETGLQIIQRRLPIIWAQRIRSVIGQASLASRGMGGKPRGGFFRT